MVGDILQPTHLLFILVIALLVLGPKRLPEVGRSLGRGLRDFRHAISGQDKDDAQPAIEAAQNGESQQSVQAAATVPPPAQNGESQQPVQAATTVSPSPQRPATVAPPAQEPASVSGEPGSTGSA